MKMAGPMLTKKRNKICKYEMHRKDGRSMQNNKNQIKSIKLQTEEIQTGNLPESEKMPWNCYLFFTMFSTESENQITNIK